MRKLSFYMLLSAVTLTTTVSFAADLPPTDEGRVLVLAAPVTYRSSYAKHQAQSIEMQERLADSYRRWQIVKKSGGGVDLRVELEQARADLVKAQTNEARAREIDAMDPIARQAELRRKDEQLRRSQERVAKATDEGIGEPDDIVGLIADTQKIQEEVELLRSDLLDFMRVRHQIQQRVRYLEIAAAAGAERLDDALFDQFKKLATLKVKTIYTLTHQVGGRPLETTVEERAGDYLVELLAKYGAPNLVEMDRGSIVGQFKEMIGLLHEMGVDYRLANGIIPSHRDIAEVLNAQIIILQLLKALEVPSVSFVTTDLPLPHYARDLSGVYQKNTEPPRSFLEAYANMADYLAYVFEMRLREDIASLKSILASPVFLDAPSLGDLEAHDWFLDADIFWPDDTTPPPAQLERYWRIADEAGRAAFRAIVALYDPTITFEGKEGFLHAAIPGNPLGMLYRLLQAAGKGFHSWNPCDEYDLDARLARKEALFKEVPVVIKTEIARSKGDIVYGEVPPEWIDYKGHRIWRAGGDIVAETGWTGSCDQFADIVGLDHEYRDVTDPEATARNAFDTIGTGVHPRVCIRCHRSDPLQYG